MTIPIFIGFDSRERAATNVLIDSLYMHSSSSLSITPLITSQLENQSIYWRKRDSKQSTDFSFSRFLVPFLMDYKGWAIFMDCDMLCLADITSLWMKRDNQFAVMCVKHDHNPSETTKFQGEIQTSYPKKNWSSMMLLNCSKCKSLTVDYVNSATGLDLHRFNWLEDESLIGEISQDWNSLVEVKSFGESDENLSANLLHWTLGGPWFNDQRLMGGRLAAMWFAARDSAMKLWD